jgi:hypothetical protein
VHARRTDSDRNDSTEHMNPTSVSETLRSSSNHRRSTEAAKGGDEKVSMFWRIFGGTILSIFALVLITAYQSHANALHELRTDISRANEARADMVKKDEFGASKTKIWDKFQDVQKEMLAESKDAHDGQVTLKERLAQFELQLNEGKTAQKEMQTLRQTVTALQEQAVLHDRQAKQADEERKELTKEIQALRERLAKVEARKEAESAPPKTGSRNEH